MVHDFWIENLNLIFLSLALLPYLSHVFEQSFRLFAFILLTIHFWATFIGTYGEWLHLLAINTLTEDASTLEEISDLILS
jgi:hypothetical protein